MARPTFHLVTDEAVHGSFDKILLRADKLPADRNGMEQWELKYVYEGKLIHSNTVLCSTKNGAGEARAIIAEAAPFWARRAWERSPSAPLYKGI